MNFNNNTMLYPKKDEPNPTKDDGLNPQCYPKEDGLNPFKGIVERINTLENVTRNYRDSFETKKLNATEGTVDTLKSTTSTITNCNIKNAQIENLRTNRLTWDLPSIDVENAEVENLHATKEIKVENLKTEEPILSNAVVGYDENGKMIPIKIAELNKKVDKVEGKGLSTNDFTDTYKNKLDNAITIDYYAELAKLIYPVGSLYWSSKSTNPASLFGGTWVQIKDRFVLACGDTYTSVGSTGGASSVTLSVSNMPSHTHSFSASNSHSHSIDHRHIYAFNRDDSNTYNGYTYSTGANTYGNKNTNKSGQFAWTSPPRTNGSASSIGTEVLTSGSSTITISGTTGSNGSGTSFSILPPYVVKYCWERTA